MKEYIGIKRIKAETEQREGVDGYKMDGYKVVYEDGYESWSPKETFESAYHESGKMSFSEALYALKRGAKIARSGWNGKGMFLTLQQGSEVDGSLMRNENAKNFYGNSKVRICSHIDMKAADGSYVVGWLASQTDMLADDWCIVE
jgi:hypothetical protein